MPRGVPLLAVAEGVHDALTHEPVELLGHKTAFDAEGVVVARGGGFCGSRPDGRRQRDCFPLATPRRAGRVDRAGPFEAVSPRHAVDSPAGTLPRNILTAYLLATMPGTRPKGSKAPCELILVRSDGGGVGSGALAVGGAHARLLLEAVSVGGDRLPTALPRWPGRRLPSARRGAAVGPATWASCTAAAAVGSAAAGGRAATGWAAAAGRRAVVAAAAAGRRRSRWHATVLV